MEVDNFQRHLAEAWLEHSTESQPLGKREFLEAAGVRNLGQLNDATALQREGFTLIWLAVDREAAGALAISDAVKRARLRRSANCIAQA